MRSTAVLSAAVLLATAVGCCAAVLHMPVHHHPHAVAAGPAFVDASKSTTVPAGGDVWPVGIFYVELDVGTPPVKFPVAIDSGSTELYIQGDCPSCPHQKPNAVYSAKASSSSRATFPFLFTASYETCDLKDMTMPCTITGKVYTDNVSIGGVGPVPVKLGAIDTQTKDFSQFQVVAGVMGLAGSSKGSVLSQLVQAGVTKDLWTLCLNEAGKTANGTMTVGGIDTSLMAPGSSLQYVPNAGDTDGFYGLRLDGGITVGDDTTPLASTDGSLAIIDSGTNILLLPQDIYQSFSSVLTTMCQTHTLAGVCGPSVTNGTLMDGSCYHLSASDIQAFPNVTFHLQDSLTLHMSASDYLLKGDVRAVAAGDASLVCLGVRNTGPNNLFIVGDTLLRNYYTVFDRTQARIGFAPVNKAKCGSM